MEDKIRQLMSGVLGIDATSIGEQFGPNDSNTWDSLSNLRMITALEECFAISLTMTEIRQMTTFGAIRDVIANKLPST